MAHISNPNPTITSSIFPNYIVFGPYRQLFGHMLLVSQEFTESRSHTTHCKVDGDQEPSAFEHVLISG